ncbi:flavin reductase family protein [Sporomusa sp.]|uniref:flavin reductase family protein n=1 Tax=Sporomusa sp. TaxID=2078658 RepID=UPI002BAC5D86|nr:flavin reductase family protein [Sporomusa sp.]HWR41998.1 flavin reductase family protein [Sporomusa sp.]
MKKQLGPSDTFFPTPITLVTSGTMEKPNIITLAWVGMVCSEPPTIAISMTNKRHSTEIIRNQGEFTVNIPGNSKVAEVDYCGIVSGRRNNKFRETHFTPVPGLQVNAPIIQECAYNLECKVVNELQIGEFIVFLGQIVETHIDNNCVDDTGRIILGKVNPLVYAAGIREYWNLGEKVGTAFNVGKQLRLTDEG